jgi:hypothetical protein
MRFTEIRSLELQTALRNASFVNPNKEGFVGSVATLDAFDLPCPGADILMRRAYALLPHVKITELLLEVDEWTGFTRHFTHLKSGDTAKEPSPCPGQRRVAVPAVLCRHGPVRHLKQTSSACTPDRRYSSPFR